MLGIYGPHFGRKCSGELKTYSIKRKKVQVGSGGFSSPFSAQRYLFFVFLSWYGLKYFLLLRKLDDKVISPSAPKLMTLQTVYKGVDPRGQLRDELGDGKDLFTVGQQGPQSQFISVRLQDRT